MQHPPVKMTLSRTLAVRHLSWLMGSPGRQRRVHPLDVVLLAKVSQTTLQAKNPVGKVWKSDCRDSKT
jgi:hypothetical protein